MANPRTAFHYQADQSVGGWTLLEPLGPGGNSEVWMARHADGRALAVKILHSRRVDSDPYRRFVDEVQFLRSDSGRRPGVLPLVDAYAPERLAPGERAWLAMPRAQPIRDALERAPASAVVGAMAEVSSTLASLASAGISHRDLKPENLFWLDGRWVIGDFGLVDFPDKPERTQNGQRLGPMHFIAPEMLANPHAAAGGPADVYSLSKTCWVLLTGQRYPPPGTHRLDEGAFRIASYTADDRAASIDALIESATQHDPGRRPTMSEFARNLRLWLDREEASGAPLGIVEMGRRLAALTAPARAAEQDRHSSR